MPTGEREPEPEEKNREVERPSKPERSPTAPKVLEAQETMRIVVQPDGCFGSPEGSVERITPAAETGESTWGNPPALYHDP